MKSDVSDAGPQATPRVEQAAPAPRLAAAAHAPVEAPALTARTSQARVGAVAAKQFTRGTPVRSSVRNESAARTSPAAAAPVPELAVVEGSAEPAAPIAPAILGKDSPAPALALVAALPPVSQAPIVPVVGALLPPLPEPPVEGIPALPDIPIVVQPPLPPALPGGVEVTVPAVPGLRVGP